MQHGVTRVYGANSFRSSRARRITRGILQRPREKVARFRALRFAGNKSEPVSSVCGVILPRALPSFHDLLRNKPLLSVAFERYRSLFSLSMFASLIVGQIRIGEERSMFCSGYTALHMQ